ncbi:MAG: hypothetical protein GY820_38570 [Gammaproteobacteria bacterium]|nr:hypothetical protein [Gammaproteobacteria bacterium]
MENLINNDAEMALLGAVLIDDHAINEVRDIQPKDFYATKHQVIWQTMVSMFDNGASVDTITLSNQLKNDNQLTKVGGSYYVIQVADKVFTATNVRHHADILKEKRLLRESRNVSIAFKEYDGTTTPQEWIAKQKRATDQIGSVTTQKLRRLEQLVAECDSQEVYDSMTKTQFPVGWDTFDKNVLLKRGDLILLAGATSSGKTAMALGMAKKLCNNFNVGFCSIEMPNVQLTYRLANSESSKQGFEGYREGLAKIIALPLYLYDAPSQSIEVLMAIVDEGIRKHKIDVFFIDYLQLIKKPRANSMHESISAISEGLKFAAKKYNIPVIALAQLSRAYSARQHKRPGLTDLKESGSLEQDADTVMFTYRPFDYLENNDKQTYLNEFKIAESSQQNFFMLLIAKQRGFRKCDIPFYFNPEKQSFHLWNDNYAADALQKAADKLF